MIAFPSHVAQAQSDWFLLPSGYIFLGQARDTFPEIWNKLQCLTGKIQERVDFVKRGEQCEVKCGILIETAMADQRHLILIRERTRMSQRLRSQSQWKQQPKQWKYLSCQLRNCQKLSGKRNPNDLSTAPRVISSFCTKTSSGMLSGTKECGYYSDGSHPIISINDKQ